VIESIMFVALGFLAASLITLVLLSAVWHRAVRLTTRRVEGAIPVSMAEIQADKDQLRAEFAMSTRRLENDVERLKLKTTEQLAEIGRKSEAIRVLKEEVDQKTARMTALETQERTLRDQLRSTEAELNLKPKALHEAEAELATKSTELAQAARTIADKSDKNGAPKSAYLDEQNPDGAKESTAQADERSGRAITKERARWARLLDNFSHYRQHFSLSSKFGTLGRLGFVVAIAAVVVFLFVGRVPNLWSFSSGFAIQASKTSAPLPSPAPLSPSVRAASNDAALLTSGRPNVREPELPPPPEPAPVVLNIPVPAEVTATYQVGGYPVRQLDRDEVAALAKRGEEFIAAGNITAARLVLQRAAEARDARAALLLGATYDPIMLEKSRVRGFAPDIATARTWYERAKEFGSAEATQRLEMLASPQPPSSE
jgi:hypothetical protein